MRPALAEVRPYEPGKPVEEVQRELGLARVVKLASNEGPLGPVASARAALALAADSLNRYPDSGGLLLRAALAERHAVEPESIALGAGADGVLDVLSQATLDPGDEVVCGWPSFPSYVAYAAKQGAVVRCVPLVDGRLNLAGLLHAVSARSKLVYICYPNNPTGTMNSATELEEYFDAVPDHVLTVVDQAYFEYVDDPDYVDAVETYFKAGKRVLVLRTFSKIYGLAALRVGYGVTEPELSLALTKTRRAFDVAQPAQEAARASLDAEAEIVIRRDRNSASRTQLIEVLRAHGFTPLEPAVANFVYADVGTKADVLFQSLLHEGVIIRPLTPFGAATAIRVSVGRTDEIQFLDQALHRMRARTAT